MVALLHSEHLYIATAATFTPSVAPTAGSLLVLSIPTRAAADRPTALTGWTLIADLSSGGGQPAGLSMFYKVAGVGETGWGISASQSELSYSEWDAPDAALLDFDSVAGTLPATGAFSLGTVTPGAADAVLVIGGLGCKMINDTDAMAVTPDSGITELDDWAVTPSVNGSPGRWVGYIVDHAPSGSYTIGGNRTTGGAATDRAGIVAAFGATAEVPPPEEPTGELEPRGPGGAIIEIYVHGDGTDRWDTALWDTGTWSEAHWVDISPWCVIADVSWGASRGDAGILTDMEAGSWTVDTFDPDRVLDPANPDSPFYPELVNGLPIRMSHEGRVIRTGSVSRLLYFYADGTGRLLGTDNVSTMARASVPEDTVLSDLLRERARDAIAAAGLSITVLPDPPGGDAPLAPWVPGEYSVWDIIASSARELLHIPYLDEHGALGFRGWRSPKRAGAVVASPELVDMTAWLDDSGLYSVVAVLDDDTSTVEVRTASPTPVYGKRTYRDRAEIPTIHGATWADSVLADRTAATLRFVPGDIRPLTGASVGALRAIELAEAITLSYPEADPALSVAALVLGIRVYAVDETKEPGNVRTRWLWRFATATIAAEPLAEDGADPLSYLVSDQDHSDYLYPDGVTAL